MRAFKLRLGELAVHLVDPFVSRALRAQGLESLRRARLVVGVSLAGAVLLLVAIVDAIASGLPVLPHWTFVLGLLLLAPVLVRFSTSVTLAANVVVAGLVVSVGLTNFIRVGSDLPPVLATAIVPLVAVLLGGWRVGLAWGGIIVLQLLLVVHADLTLLPAVLLPAEGLELSRRFLGVGELLVILSLALVYDGLKSRSLTELAEARDRAERTDRAKSDFVASLSHEVRTPLSVMIGVSDILLDSDLSSEQRELVRTLRRSGGDLLGLVNDVLDLSKIEAGRLEIELIPFDVTAAVRDARDQLRHAASEKGLALDLDLGADLPARVYGDPGRVRQVLMNLVSNAIKFTKEGGVEIEVKVERRHADQVELEFAVTDTGVGIPDDQIPRLFERYAQIDASTARLSGGSGLGLPISQELVALMKGKLLVRSHPGHGSRFWFSLPLRVARENAADRAQRKPASAGVEPPSDPPRAPRERAKARVVAH